MVFEFTGVLQRAADNQRTVAVEAETLGDALGGLVARHPAITGVLFDNTGQIRKAHRMFINDELVSEQDHSLPLVRGDRVGFLTAIAGG